MGCDIHLYVERAIERKGQIYWVSADNWKENESAYNWPGLQRKSWKRWPVYHDRNYFLFALLAGVRNYDDIEPFAEPRGLPPDLSSLVREEYEVWEGDAHSASWFTLKELEAMDWDRLIKFTRLVNKKDAESYRQTKELPGTWCMAAYNAPELVELEMTATARELCSEFVDKTLPRIRELAKRHPYDCDPVDPEKVRVVFWFDN